MNGLHDHQHVFTRKNRVTTAAGTSAAVGSPPPTALPMAALSNACPRSTSSTLQLLGSASHRPRPAAT